MPDNYLPEVRSQYEALPYPPCNPDDDRTRLARTWLEDLPMINHYCFAGKQSFRQGFRALVAGGGTGDATIFLAEQLRATDAHIVHLDMSEASIALARRRADIRGLTNISWLHDSLLNLPTLGLDKFDYINCSGVLHHLADPDLGFRALQSVLKRGGALGLMVYATTGRLGVYQMQALMRLVNDGQADERGKIANTRDLLASLPASNWFKRSEDLHHDHQAGDAGIYDLLLHAQDRSYSVGELFDWLAGPADGAVDGHGLHLAFTDVQRGRSSYLPHMVLGSKPPAMAANLRKPPRRRQYEMAELMGGTLITHSFYATRDAACTAPYGDARYIPFFFHEPLTGELAAQVFASNRGQPFVLRHQHCGVSVSVNPGKYGPQILRLIDGQRSFGEIFDQFRKDWHGQNAAPSNEVLFADFSESFETLNALDRLLLKHPEADAALQPEGPRIETANAASVEVLATATDSALTRLAGCNDAHHQSVPQDLTPNPRPSGLDQSSPHRGEVLPSKQLASASAEPQPPQNTSVTRDLPASENGHRLLLKSAAWQATEASTGLTAAARAAHRSTPPLHAQVLSGVQQQLFGYQGALGFTHRKVPVKT